MWIQISSGNGPEECELAVSLFLQFYQDELARKHIRSEIIGITPGIIKGNMKSVLLSIEDSACKDDLLHGSILWICKSPYRPGHKRKNWFISLETLGSPQTITLNEKDIRFESMRSTGPGGQNVNKVESAVRAYHAPTSLVATAREERSQYMNKKLAVARLTNMIQSMNAEQNSMQQKTMWQQHNSLERGNPVRTYIGPEFKRSFIPQVP